jgi:hypothetical protein
MPVLPTSCIKLYRLTILNETSKGISAGFCLFELCNVSDTLVSMGVENQHPDYLFGEPINFTVSRATAEA